MSDTLLLDMDGVLADFVGSACRLFGKSESSVTQWHIEKDWGITQEEFWAKIAEAGEDFWANMEPTSEFTELIRITDNFLVVTSPSLDPACAAGKTKWLQTHLPERHRRKYLICAAKKRVVRGRFLVDDSTNNCLTFSWNSAPGEIESLGVVWPAVYNRPADRVEALREDVVKWLRLYYHGNAVQDAEEARREAMQELTKLGM